MRKLVPALLVALTSACSSDLVQPPQDSEGFTRIGDEALSLAGCDPIGFNNFSAHYPCDAVVRIYAPSGWADDMLAAAQEWEGALAPMGITFSTSTGTESLTLSVVDRRNLGGSGLVVYCGSGNDGGITLNIWYDNASFKPSHCLQTSPHPVLVHEMNHALGFNTWSKKPWTTNCVAHRDGNIYNESPCLYEMERMLAGYDLRGPFHLLKALVVNFSISPTTLTLDPTDQTVVTPTRQCSPYNISMSYCPSALTYQWSSDDPSVATVTPSGDTRSATITAVSPGTTSISVTLVGPDSLIASGLSGGSQQLASVAPKSIQVTVAPPPPPVATDIDIVPQYTLLSTDSVYPHSNSVTAVVYDQYGNQMTGQTITWSIDYSTVAKFLRPFGGGNPTGQTVTVIAQGTGNTPIRAAIGSLNAVGTIQVNCHVNNTCIP